MKIELVQMDASQAPEIARLLNDPRVWCTLSDIVPFPYSEKDALDFIALVRAQGSPLESYTVLADGRVAGIVGYECGKLNKSHVAVIGYWYGREFWGRGIATAALKLLLEKAKAAPQIRRIEATAFAFNTGSRRVLEKCGFVLEATLKDALSKEGKIFDEAVYYLPGDTGSGS